MGAVKISYLSLFLYLLLIVVPIVIFILLKLRLIWSLLIAVLRMIVQLAFVAIYLEYIFKWNHILINVGWVLIMILVANWSILKQSGLKFKIFALFTGMAYLFSVLFSIITLFIVFDAKSLFSARYLIPIGGMILGNILRGNIVALDRFYHSLRNREEEYIYYIFLGAYRTEALLPFIREALKAAISPFIATVAIMGLVALPGMMTGQILGGASPVVAIQYQVMIMIAIFVTSTLSTLLGILSSILPAFDSHDRLKKHIFTEET